MLRRVFTVAQTKGSALYKSAVRQNFASQVVKASSAQTPSTQNKALDFEEQRDLNDLRLIAEENTATLRNTSNIYFQEWVNDRKTVFQASARNYPYLPYLVLSGAVGLYWLYQLYRGDSKYKYLVAVPIISVLLFRKGVKNQMRSVVPYVTEINLHRSGKAADFVVFSRGTVKRYEGVPLSKVNVKKGDYEATVQVDNRFQEIVKPDQNGNVTHTTNAFRSLGIAEDGFLAEIDKEFAVIPFEYTGNQFALESIFAGKDVNVNNI